MTGTTSTAPRFGGWRRQPDPDVATVTSLYTDGRTEREIARLLGISRQRVADTLADAGVARRRPGHACPLEPEEIRALVDSGTTQADLARRFGVASATAGRWLAECGIGDPDPRIDRGRLRQLYVDDGRTAREVAVEFGVPHHRVIRELALAGIQRRSQHERVARGRRVSVTDAAIEELYVQRELSIRELTSVFGVSDEYLRKRLRQAGFAKRPGTFRPKLPRSRADLSAAATELYANAGLNLREVAAELEVSSTLTRELLHEAGVPMRPPGVPPVSSNERERRLLADLFADEDVLDVLGRFGITLQEPDTWTRPAVRRAGTNPAPRRPRRRARHPTRPQRLPHRARVRRRHADGPEPSARPRTRGPTLRSTVAMDGPHLRLRTTPHAGRAQAAPRSRRHITP